MYSFVEILRESKINVRSPKLPKNWKKDKKIISDRFEFASDFMDLAYGPDKDQISSVTTSDGLEVFFTREGKKEFKASFMKAFIEPGLKVAASKKLLEKPYLAGEVLSVIRALKEIISQAVIEEESEDSKSHRNTLGFSTITTPITINGKDRNVKIKIKYNEISELQKGGIQSRSIRPIYYYHWLTENQKNLIPVISSFEFLD